MSADKRQFSITLESNLELKADKRTSRPTPVPDLPTLDTVLSGIGPLPHEALFLGIASDGLPVLLNLYDPAPGPLLILGEAGAGKTNFLQTVARSLIQTHASDDLQYGVITDHPDEWKTIGNTKHRAGIFSADQKKAQDFMLSLSLWAHQNKNTQKSMLLLIDDLESVAKLDFDALQNFRWLLARGTSRRVWTILTMNADRYGQVLAWIPIFRTRIFGRIRNARVAEALSGDKSSALELLEAPIQLSLRENENWVKFWLPSF